jgi:hypothetical protein
MNIRDLPIVDSVELEAANARKLQGPMPEILKGVHAVNVPAPDLPFWRVNLPSNFSPKNVPDSKNTWSILCERSFIKASDLRHEPKEIEAALRQIGFVPPSAQVVSVFATELEHGYPVPFAGRDKLLNEVQRALERLDIYSRGRWTTPSCKEWKSQIACAMASPNRRIVRRGSELRCSDLQAVKIGNARPH